MYYSFIQILLFKKFYSNVKYNFYYTHQFYVNIFIFNSNQIIIPFNNLADALIRWLTNEGNISIQNNKRATIYKCCDKSWSYAVQHKKNNNKKIQKVC